MKQTTLTIAEAKRQIEELQRHIEHLSQNPEYRLVKSIEDIGLPFQICGQKIKWEKIDSDRVADVFHIKLPLPIANTDWTFEVFEWVMKYTKEYTNCEDIRAYPTHIPGSKATEMCIKANIYKQKA